MPNVHVLYIQVLSDDRQLFERSFQVFCNLQREYSGGGEIRGSFERIVFEPEDVEAGFVAFGEFVVGEGFEAFAFHPIEAIASFCRCGILAHVLSFKRRDAASTETARHELIKVDALGSTLFEREVLDGV